MYFVNGIGQLLLHLYLGIRKAGRLCNPLVLGFLRP